MNARAPFLSALAAGWILVLSPAPHAQRLERFELAQPLFGSEMRAVVYARTEAYARETLGRAVEPLEKSSATVPAGTACDIVLNALRAADVPRARVALGGVVVLGDAPPGEDGWTVVVGGRVPGYEPRILVEANAGIADRAGAEPETAWITVIAADGTTADAVARMTAANGRHEGRMICERRSARLLIEDPRFVPLFDGETLTGWTTSGGRYDGEAVWNVEDGALTGRTGSKGEGGLIYTDRHYASFELQLETRIDHPFDSGIFVRMIPELKGAQVTLDYRPDGEIGGIYSEGYLQHNTEAKAKWKEDDWNHFEVRCTGFDLSLEVWMNGELVTDYQLPPDSPGYTTTGLIGLQVHGGNPGENRAQFRDVRIRELPIFGEDASSGAGWEPLFDGRTLDGWEVAGHQEGYRVRDGVLLFPMEGDGHIRTTADFRDFRLRLDFKATRMANGGVFLRSARGDGNPSFSGCEVQILDDHDWEAVTGHELKPWQFTGSLYGAVAPRVKALAPIGEWNTYEILCRGSRLAVGLNGHVLYDVDTLALEPEQGAPFAERAPEGFIGLQHHSPEGLEGEASFWFRNVHVQRLEEGSAR